MKKVRQPFEIKAFYTMADMAKYMGYSRKGARCFLQKLNINIYYVGNRALVYLTDLQSQAPELFNSLLEASSLDSFAKDLDDSELEQVKDDDEFNKNQLK